MLKKDIIIWSNNLESNVSQLPPKIKNSSKQTHSNNFWQIRLRNSQNNLLDPQNTTYWRYPQIRNCQIDV